MSCHAIQLESFAGMGGVVVQLPIDFFLFERAVSDAHMRELILYELAKAFSHERWAVVGDEEWQLGKRPIPAMNALVFTRRIPSRFQDKDLRVRRILRRP